MLRIGIYPRKSVYRDNSDSVQVQIRACKDYAKLMFQEQKLEFKIYDKDEGFSGKNTNRPSFHELMADVKAGNLDIVMVYKLDRISRSVKDFSEIYETLQEHNVSFLSVKESFDTSTPMGRTVMYILSAFAQLERENTAERVSDNMLALGEAGKWTGGTLPAGMTSIRQKIAGKEHSFLMVDDSRIGTVHYIYDLYDSGMTLTGIERRFRDEGIRTEKGSFFGTNQIHSVLANPVYCSNAPEAYYYFMDKGYKVPDLKLFDGTKGLIAYGRTKQSGGFQKKSDSYSIAIGMHKPVIPAKTWIACQERFGENKMYRSNKYEVGILKGVLRCKCGARIDIRTYRKNGNLFSYYYCSKMSRQGKGACNTGYVKVDDIDTLFVQKLREMKLNKDLIQLRENKTYTDTSKLRADLKRIKESIRNLTSALMGNMESTASAYIISKIEELDKEKNSLERKLAAAEQNNLAVATSVETRDYIYYNLCRLLDHFDSMTYTEKNELIRRTVTSCVLDENNIHIIF